jgi:hypothetical protein
MNEAYSKFAKVLRVVELYGRYVQNSSSTVSLTFYSNNIYGEKMLNWNNDIFWNVYSFAFYSFELVKFDKKEVKIR